MNFRHWTCLIWLPVYFKQNLGLSNEIFFRQHAVKFTFLSSILNLYLSLPNNVWRLIVFAPFLIIISSGRHFHLKKLRWAARKSLGYFVWKITILRQKILFFPIAEGGVKIFWVFCMKNHDFTPKNHIFSNFRGGACRVHPPLDPPLYINYYTGSLNLSRYIMCCILYWFPKSF
jgi:hypothetical protein